MKMNQNAIDAASATTGELIVSTAREDEESQPLKLFTVTLDWNPADSAEGDYSDNVWALDEAQAIEKLATEMSEHPDASAETAEERAAFVKWAVESASLYAAVCVSSGIITNLRGVLAGPHGQLSESATADFASVVALLSKHGVTA